MVYKHLAQAAQVTEGKRMMKNEQWRWLASS